jgi:hypothetical protein
MLNITLLQGNNKTLTKSEKKAKKHVTVLLLFCNTKKVPFVGITD